MVQRYEPINMMIDDKVRPIFIVGMCPGKQRKRDQDFKVFSGNRTGDFIQELIKGLSNLYLTNVFNWIVDEIVQCDINDGLDELIEAIKQYNPKKIICLGAFAYKSVKLVHNSVLDGIEVIKLKHPSYVLRFNKDKIEYGRRFLAEIK